MIIVLFVLIGAAAVAQFAIVNGDDDRFPGPASPGELPNTTPTATTSPS